MDNFSQEKDEKELVHEVPESDDIEFEEVVDIDEIQKKLQKQLDEEVYPKNDSEPQIKEFSDEETEDVEDEAEDELDVEDQEIEVINKEEVKAKSTASILAKPTMEVDPNAKKYVIYIDSDNVNFIESLSINDRRLVINKILRDECETIVLKKKNEKKQKFIRHAIVATITFVIGFPLMFYSVNKAMELTLDNYQQAKENFSKLYKEKGKIKSAGSPTVNGAKY